MTREAIAKAWDRYTFIPLIGLSLVFLALYAIPIIAPSIDQSLKTGFEVSQNVIWVIFVIDVVGRFFLASRKWLFLRNNGIEIIAVALPAIRPLRALRLLSVVTIGLRRVAGVVRYRVAVYVLGAAIMLWFIAGLAVTEAERGFDGANIQNVWQGWWWAFITLATVGYGDKFPVSPEGQWVAVAIVLTGIALLGTVSALLASWFVDSMKDSQQAVMAEEEDTNKVVKQLLKEVQTLKAETKRLGDQVEKYRNGTS